MGKKIIVILLGLGILLPIIVPTAVFAEADKTEENYAQCCKLWHDVSLHVQSVNGEKIEGLFTFEKGKIVGFSETCIVKGQEINVDYITDERDYICMDSFRYLIIDLIFYFFLVISILIGLFAGRQFILADKSKDVNIKSKRIKKGRNFLILAVIILAVTVLLTKEILPSVMFYHPL